MTEKQTTIQCPAFLGGTCQHLGNPSGICDNFYCPVPEIKENFENPSQFPPQLDLKLFSDLLTSLAEQNPKTIVQDPMPDTIKNITTHLKANPPEADQLIEPEIFLFALTLMAHRANTHKD